MSLRIRSLKGVFRVRVQPGDTVLRLKQVIEESRGKNVYPRDEQLLVFKGKFLKNESTVESNNINKSDFVYLLLAKPHLHGTTIVGLKLLKSAILGGDGRRTYDDYGIDSEIIRKTEKFGRNVMIGTCGDGRLGDYIRRCFKGFISVLEKHHIDIRVDDCSQRAYDVLQVLKKEKGNILFKALLAGIDDNKPRMFVVNSAGVWEENDWYCIGSGGSYAAMEANKMNASMDEKEAVELVFRSIFWGALHDYCTGGLARVMVMTATSNGVSFKEYIHSISDMMDTYGIKFDENSFKITKVLRTNAPGRSPPGALPQPNKRRRKYERAGRKMNQLF